MARTKSDCFVMFEFLARGKARAEDTNAFLVFYAHECLAATVQTAVFFRQQIFFCRLRSVKITNFNFPSTYLSKC